MRGFCLSCLTDNRVQNRPWGNAWGNMSFERVDLGIARALQSTYVRPVKHHRQFDCVSRSGKRPISHLAWQRMTAVESPRNDLEPLLSVKKVAEYLGISESGVYRLCRAGDLAGVKVGGRTLFEPREVRQFIEASRRQGADGPTPEPAEKTEAR